MAAGKKERLTVRVSNIPYTATAIDLLDFLESVLGKGSIFAVEIFSDHKNWKSRGYGRVQFETLETKAKATALSLQDKLVFRRLNLALSDSYEDVVVRPVEPRNRIDGRLTLHAGFMTKEEVMCVVERWKGVKVWVMPERRCVQCWVFCDGESYKLEVFFEDVVLTSGCVLNGLEPSAVLFELKFAPKIYKKISGPGVSSRLSADRYHICKEDQGFLWVRATDISSRLPIGQSFALCCEIVEGSLPLDIFSCLPCYKNHIKNLTLEERDGYSSPSGLVPFVKSEAISGLDYEIVFQLNSLVHTQKISLGAVDSELIEFISTLTVDLALFLLQKVHKLTSICYDPLEFMRTQFHLLSLNQIKLPSSVSRLISNNVMNCHRALVTPTKIYLLGPEVESWNYVVKNFASYAADFMRVTFVDEDWGRLQPHHVSTHTEQGLFSKPYRTPIYHRILSVLRDGIVIGNKKFEFLAFSASQLRSNAVWMFASNDNVRAEDIREWMGSFSKIRSVSKCAARMGQLFSSSKQTLVVPVQDVEVIPDIETTTDGVTYCFSDGIGKISLSFAKQVAQKCGLNHVPSAFQIRYGGYKGVIAVDPNSSNKLSLRSSMLKFESNNRMLNVTKWSESMPCYLNREIVVLLSTLGVKDQSFEALLQEQIHLLGSMMSSKDAALAVLESMGMIDGKSILPRMLLNGYEPKQEPYLSMILQAYFENQLYDTRYRCRLHVPKGRILLGCLDETGVLNYGQVFVRMTLTKSELKGENQDFFQRVDDKTAVLKGKVVVTKNPCLHPGDVRVLEAVYEVALEEKNWVDCVIFPQKGERPHPNECSGGDLDGDLYFISWDENLIPPQTIPPMDYTACRPRIMDHDVTMEEIQQFFVHYMINDTLGVISTAHLVHADREPEKANSPKCLQLANLHSMAVDFAKTGAPAEMPRALKPTEYPDFLERYDKATYVSQGILGKLYRATIALTNRCSDSEVSWSKELAQSVYDKDLEVPGFEAFLGPAKDYKEMYIEKMNGLMAFYSATREVEILTGNLQRHAAYLQRDNRRYMEVKDRILESMRSLQREAKGWFESSCGVQQRQKMASAWYHVTYNPCHCEDSGNCISFPWVVGDTLLSIKSECVRMEVSDVVV